MLILVLAYVLKRYVSDTRISHWHRTKDVYHQYARPSIYNRNEGKILLKTLDTFFELRLSMCSVMPDDFFVMPDDFFVMLCQNDNLIIFCQWNR